MIHLSRSSSLKSLSPKIPDILINQENSFEDSTIQRICFSNSIKNCLLGLQFNQADFIENELKLFIYKPKLNQNLLIKSNKEIVSERLVFDAHITKELWSLSDVIIDLVGEVRVENKVKMTIEYEPIRIGNKKFLKENGKLETYHYKHKILIY